ncbi:MAG: CRTAC1 family protein, partial [Planctomycetota bacterium]
ILLGTDRVFLNRAAGEGPGGRKFLDGTETSGLPEVLPRKEGEKPPQFCLAGDVDNDGDVDLFVARYCEPEKPAKGVSKGIPKTEGGRLIPGWKDRGSRSGILLNDGKGTFRPFPFSGVGEPAETTCAAVVMDFDADGLLDLFTGNFYVAYAWSYDAYPDRLYKGVGGGRFVECTSRAGLLTFRQAGYRNSSRPTYGVAHCDWNGDGWQDLLVCAYGRQWNNLWKNNGDGTFTEVGGSTGFDGDDQRDGVYPKGIGRRKESPFRANGNMFSVACGDFDCDGDVDLFLGEITHWWAGPSSDRSDLLVNLGPAKAWRFSREGESRGIVRKHANPRGWNQGDIHVGWLDVDNDGLLDLLIAASDYPDDQFLRLYLQKEDHTFTDATEAAGFAWRNPTGISFGDFDRDGRVDILVGNNNMRLTAGQRKGRVLEAALFHNRAAPENHFLAVRLSGRGEGGANRMGIGARIEVRVGERTLVREIYGGGGHCGQQNMPVAHFGLGRADRVDLLRVRWPDRAHTAQIFRNLEADAFILIREGSDHVQVERRVIRRQEGEVPPKGGEGEEDFSKE